MYLKLLCTVYLKLPILFTFDGLSLTVWQIDKWWIYFSFSHSVFLEKIAAAVDLLVFLFIMYRLICVEKIVAAFDFLVVWFIIYRLICLEKIVAAVDLLVVLFIIQIDLAWLLQLKLLLEELQFDRRFVEISWFTTSSSTRIQNVAAFSTETFFNNSLYIHFTWGIIQVLLSNTFSLPFRQTFLLISSNSLFFDPWTFCHLLTCFRDLGCFAFPNTFLNAGHHE